MKRTVIILTYLFCLCTLNAQEYNYLEIDSNGKEKLLGQVNREGLASHTFGTWFNKNHDDYIPNEALIQEFKDSLSSYKIKVFLGTWCGDSKREVPRFYKVLDLAGFPENQLEVIAVDRIAEAYKKSPNGEEIGLNIHRVPTFILYNNGKEINRIVEFPVETLERDLFNITILKKYTPNYRAANYMGDILQNNSISELIHDEEKLLVTLSEITKGSSELNTLGYVKLRDLKLKEALYIFKLNTKLFPYTANTYDSLGEANIKAKQYEKALKNYQKVLALKPDDANAMKMISQMEGVKN